jgi:hypothetical protein
VLPGGSTVAGKSIGQWTADWWNWAGAAPVVGDPDGGLANTNQSGPVFFVAGTSGATATRSFTVPGGKYVLLPLINWLIAAGADPPYPDTATEADAVTTGTIDPAKLFATFDSESVSDLASHREKSPLNFTFTTVPGATGLPPGTYMDANSDGYWLMLKPLSAGEHTLHFGGTTNDFGGISSFTVDTTDHITVEGSVAVPLPAAALAAMPVLAGMVAVHARRRWTRSQR